MKITFVYIDDPHESDEANAVRRQVLATTIRIIAEREMRGERFEPDEPRLTDVGAMLVKERVGFLPCQLQ